MKHDNHIPKYLKKRGRAFYKKVREEFVIDKVHDKERLALAAGELDTQDAAQEAIEEHGHYITNRYGNVIENPAVKTMRDSRTLFVRIVRELGLDLVTAEEARPPGKYIR